MRTKALLAVAAIGLVACTSHQAPPEQAAQPEPQVEDSEPDDPETAAARAWIAAYQRGEAVKRTDDPAVNYVATGTAPCVALPPSRPEGFELVYWDDPYEDMVERYEGVTGPGAEGCRFEWDMAIAS